MPPAILTKLRASPLTPQVVAAIFGFGFFLAHGGTRILNPTDVTWIQPGSDWGFHQVGWIFYRHAEWSLLPLGDIPAMQYPGGTTVGFNDGIPWLATIFKLLSPVLPATWQYIGLWLALCFTLQGFFGARLVQAIAPRVCPVAAALGGALFVASPILLHRLVHEALCAHFLLLAAITLNLRPSRRWPRAAPLLLVAVATGVHPYLAVMVAVLAAAAVVRAWQGGHIRRVASVVALAAAGFAIFVVLSWWMGYVGAGEQTADRAARGFGYFTTDLSSPLNAGRYTWFLPTRGFRPGAFEDPGYVGLGGLLLGFSGLALLTVGRVRREPPLPWRRALPLIVATVLLTLYAASPRLAIFGRVVLDLSKLYEPLAVITGPFRVAGRFIWPLTYVLVAGGVAVWTLRRPRLLPWVLAVALAAQMADMKNLIGVSPWKGHYPPKVWSPQWELARGDYDHLALYPPRCADTSFTCCGNLSRRPPPGDMYFSSLVTRLGLTFNGGGTARARRSVMMPYCEKLFADVAAARLDARTIYRVAGDKEGEFLKQNPAAPCVKLDGELTCVAPEARGPFRERLERDGVKR